jgi:hypothetical protein
LLGLGGDLNIPCMPALTETLEKNWRFTLGERCHVIGWTDDVKKRRSAAARRATRGTGSRKRSDSVT